MCSDRKPGSSCLLSFLSNSFILCWNQALPLTDCTGRCFLLGAGIGCIVVGHQYVRDSIRQTVGDVRDSIRQTVGDAVRDAMRDFIINQDAINHALSRLGNRDTLNGPDHDGEDDDEDDDEDDGQDNDEDDGEDGPDDTATVSSETASGIIIPAEFSIATKSDAALLAILDF